MFYVRKLFVFECSIFELLDKGVTFYLFFQIKKLLLLVSCLLCLFFHIKELSLFRKIRKKHGGPL